MATAPIKLHHVGGGKEAELVEIHTLAPVAGRRGARQETFDVAAYQVQGHRGVQQDRYTVQKIGERMLFVGVFDGHGDHGDRIAEVVARTLPTTFATRIGASLDPNTIATALKDAFAYVDELLATREEAKSDESGTTAVVTVITPTHYISANVGDSRAVLLRRSRDGTLASGPTLSVDHDVENVAEKTRACAAGCTMDGEYFMLGDAGLQLSRAFGDMSMKQGTPQILLSEPDVKIVRRSPADDAYLWLFSDGVTDAMAGYEHHWYIQLINRKIAAGVTDTKALARAVVQDALTSAVSEKPISAVGEVSSDNITALLVRLPRGAVGTATTRRIPRPVLVATGSIKRKPRRIQKAGARRGVTAKNTELTMVNL